MAPSCCGIRLESNWSGYAVPGLAPDSPPGCLRDPTRWSDSFYNKHQSQVIALAPML
jgi:hypothetical protein